LRILHSFFFFFFFLTQEGEVGSRVAYKLDERLSHGPAEPRMRRNHVRQAEKWENDPDPAHLQRLKYQVLSPETREPFVPDACQQLLDVRVSHKLYSRNDQSK
jgi:hypothetical protein